jgi:hypothetical protein
LHGKLFAKQQKLGLKAKAEKQNRRSAKKIIFFIYQFWAVTELVNDHLFIYDAKIKFLKKRYIA